MNIIALHHHMPPPCVCPFVYMSLRVYVPSCVCPFVCMSLRVYVPCICPFHVYVPSMCILHLYVPSAGVCPPSVHFIMRIISEPIKILHVTTL